MKSLKFGEKKKGLFSYTALAVDICIYSLGKLKTKIKIQLNNKI